MRFRKGPVFKVIFFILLLTIVYSSPLNSFISTIRSDTIPEPAFDTSAIPTQQKGDDESDIHNGAEHGDKFADTYLFVFFIVGGAVLGRYIARKLRQPPVLGELLIGVIMGALLYQFQAPIMTLIRHQDDVNQIIQNNLTKQPTTIKLNWDK